MIDLIKEYSNYYVSIQETQKYEILDNIKDDWCVIDIIEIAMKKYIEKYSGDWFCIGKYSHRFGDSYTYTIYIINMYRQYKDYKRKKGNYECKFEISYPYSKFKTDMNYYLDKLKDNVSKAIGHEALGYKVR